MILLRIPWARAALDRIATHHAASLHFMDWRSFLDALPLKLRRPLSWESDALDTGRLSSCCQTCTLPCPTSRPAVRDAGPASIREKLGRAYAWARGTDNPRALKDALQSGPNTWSHGCHPRCAHGFIATRARSMAPYPRAAMSLAVRRFCALRTFGNGNSEATVL
jgi:hypothetical protein